MQDKRWIDELAKKQKPGDEFAELVRQLVSKETGKSAHVYPSKDGGIDVHEADSGWGWQCKFVAERPREVTKKAIAIVNDEFKVLTRNLQDNSPKTGQVQYGIWYEHGAVTRYTFATNLMLPNLHSRKLVIKEIEAKFQNLKYLYVL